MSDTPVIRSAELRAQNRHRLLSTLRRQGMCSRGELGKITGLSQAGISTLSAQLIEQGLVRVHKPEARPQEDSLEALRGKPDAGPRSSLQKSAQTRLRTENMARESAKAAASNRSGTARRGRPEYNLTLAENACTVITAALSIDLLYVAISDYSGQCLAEQNKALNTLDLSAQEIIDAFFESIESMLDKMQVSPLMISVSFQGVTSLQSGEFLWSPIIKARHVPIGHQLQSHFGIPVNVNHNCRLVADALHDLHSDTLGDSFAAIYLSQGVGMGLYLGGAAFSGTRSSGLELGHVIHREGGALCRCGKLGCIEAYAADYAIVRSFLGNSNSKRKERRTQETDMEHIIEAALSNNTSACEAFYDAGKAVGQGLGNLFNLFDPMPIAFIGRSNQAISLMMSGLESSLQMTAPQLNDESSQDDKPQLHCYDNEHALLRHGLTLNALSSADQQLALQQQPSLA